MHKKVYSDWMKYAVRKVNGTSALKKLKDSSFFQNEREIHHFLTELMKPERFQLQNQQM